MSEVKIEHDSNEFAFKLEESIADKCRIKDEAGKLVGNRLALAELETSVERALIKYQQEMISRFGEAGYKELTKRLQELQKEKKFDEEYKELTIKLNDNPMFYTYMQLQLELNNVYGYARLIVLCTDKPDGYNFYDQEEEELLKILKKLEDEQAFFRK